MSGVTYPDLRLSPEELDRVNRAQTRRLAIRAALLAERQRLGRELEPAEVAATRKRAEQDLEKRGAIP